MSRALFIVDVQNDFTEGGALGVVGGDAVARGVTDHLRDHGGDYDLIVASRDWHSAVGDNGGHFSATPDFVDSWPVHCVEGTPGAEYDPEFDTSTVTHHLYKGQGKPDYSLFQGVTASGETAAQLLERFGITEIDLVGIATDYCVRSSALDALGAGVGVRVLRDLVAGVAPESSASALEEIAAAGGQVIA